MKTIKIFLFISLGILMFNGCGGIGKDYQDNLEKLDKVYGKCDNPKENYDLLNTKFVKTKRELLDQMEKLVRLTYQKC